MGLSHLSAEEVAALVEASCAAQGVPVKITDPTLVRQVGALLGGRVGASRAHPRSGSTRDAAGLSVAPHDADAGGVQLPGSLPARLDDDVVDQGFDDGVLSGEVQVVPRSA